eukprot:362783-Chlamydomonas_euryale.AAC.17
MPVLMAAMPPVDADRHVAQKYYVQQILHQSEESLKNAWAKASALAFFPKHVHVGTSARHLHDDAHVYCLYCVCRVSVCSDHECRGPPQCLWGPVRCRAKRVCNGAEALNMLRACAQARPNGLRY